ncbi:regulatory protein GAL4 [Aspergillus udagawae]|uniref:Regulatory protein GAL4 n=1 Tax=Aspergillus udagawae TaxID=91492 RepID=A0A8H3PCP5_9EURO|nr:regulatory protein GAL4 [Aspergillus udagawae]
MSRTEVQVRVSTRCGADSVDPTVRPDALAPISTDNMQADFQPRHLTEVENRVQMLEMALDRLFPAGEVDSVLRLVLNGDLPQDKGHTLQDCVEKMQHASDFSLSSTSEEAPSDIPLELSPAAQYNGVDTLLGVFNQPVRPDEINSAKEDTRLVDCYFSTYHTMYPLVHEATFRSELENPTLRSNSSAWPILRDMVLAFGAWLSPEGPETYAKYYDRAKSHLQRVSIFTGANLSMVQALVLLSDFAQRQGSPDESQQYSGMAIQMAVNLNLYREPAQQSPPRSLLTQEIQRRVWWSVYCLGSCSAKMYGRPLLLPEDSLITVNFPSNINDSVRAIE